MKLEIRQTIFGMSLLLEKMAKSSGLPDDEIVTCRDS